ncbi:MAG: hypothetical protein J6Y78_09330 [Paludibacteraceae bacterium]|nr:hypothetical protein [Paludibacteraceae bacterium]
MKQYIKQGLPKWNAELAIKKIKDARSSLISASSITAGYPPSNEIDKTIDKLDYITEMLERSMIGESRKISSGTNNYRRQGNVFGYDFPTVTYEVTVPMLDEFGNETEERDYEEEQERYEQAYKDAKELAERMDIDFREDNPDSYVDSDDVDVPFAVTIRDGYYDGMQIVVLEGHDEHDIYTTNEWGNEEYVDSTPMSDEEMDDYYQQMNRYLDKLCTEYGWKKDGILFMSRKNIKSASDNLPPVIEKDEANKEVGSSSNDCEFAGEPVVLYDNNYKVTGTFSYDYNMKEDSDDSGSFNVIEDFKVTDVEIKSLSKVDEDGKETEVDDEKVKEAITNLIKKSSNLQNYLEEVIMNDTSVDEVEFEFEENEKDINIIG